MPHIQRLFAHSSLLKVLASNMRDGEEISLHPAGHFTDVVGEIRNNLDTRLGPGNAGHQDYLIEFEEVCFGALPTRSGSSYILRGQSDPLGDTPDWYTCVITVTHWMRYLSTAAIHELALAADIPLPFLPMGGIEDEALYRILIKLRRGEFTPKHDFSLGFPVVWITPRPEFERRLHARLDAADVARDFLGLVHREEKEYLIALHIPAAAVKLVDSARPTFSDAGAHRRFMVIPDDTPPPYRNAWGQTLDLDAFEVSGRRDAGAAERVCARILARHLGGVRIPFEYLGRLQSTRGRVKATDADFADCQVARDRMGYAQTVKKI